MLTSFWHFFDHLLPSVDIFYLLNIDKKSTFLDYLPPSSCKRSLWTTPQRQEYLDVKFQSLSAMGIFSQLGQIQYEVTIVLSILVNNIKSFENILWNRLGVGIKVPLYEIFEPLIVPCCIHKCLFDTSWLYGDIRSHHLDHQK